MPDEKKSGEAAYLNPGIKAEHKEKATALFKAIASLPENQKLAFTLVRVQGLNYEEVCAILQMSVKAVESLVSRAKENLKKKLDKHDNH
jgi:RNA polymerase sigma-70 factor (ECF subfamily)